MGCRKRPVLQRERKYRQRTVVGHYRRTGIAGPRKTTGSQFHFLPSLQAAGVKIRCQRGNHVPLRLVNISLLITQLPAFTQLQGQFFLLSIQTIQMKSILIVHPRPFHFGHNFFLHHVTVVAAGGYLCIDQGILIERSQQGTERLFYRQFIVFPIFPVQLPPGVAERSAASVPHFSTGCPAPLDFRIGHLQPWVILQGYFQGLIQRNRLLRSRSHGGSRGGQQQQQTGHSGFPAQPSTVSFPSPQMGNDIYQPVEHRNDNQGQHGRHNQSANHYRGQRALYFGSSRGSYRHGHKAQ